MNNITEKYNGKEGLEGSIIHFKIVKYEIDLLQKTIFVKYDMIVENSLCTNTIAIQKKSYILQDIKGSYDDEGNEITAPNLLFTNYQNYPLQLGIDEGLTTLEDVFFENTLEHILYINNYTEEDLYIIAE
jgi:hypothetical protein